VTSSTQCLLSFSFSFFERGLTSSSSSELSPSRIRILSLFAIYATAFSRTHLFALTSCNRLSVAFLSKLSLNIFSRMNLDSLTLIPQNMTVWSIGCHILQNCQRYNVTVFLAFPPH